jgi:hypothetical protein
VAKVLTFLGFIVRTWLFWMSGAFSIALTVFVLVRDASGSPVSPTQTLLILGCLSVIAFVLSGLAALRHERARAHALEVQLAALTGRETKNAKVRNDLTALMLDGQALQQRLAATDEPLDTIEPGIEAWAAKTEEWLGENLEASYIARFRNGAGIPMGSFVMRRGLNKMEGPLNGFMRVRLARLGEFIGEHS